MKTYSTPELLFFTAQEEVILASGFSVITQDYFQDDWRNSGGGEL